MLHVVAEPSPVPFRAVPQPTAPDLDREILVGSQGLTGSPVLLTMLVVALVTLVLVYIARVRRRASLATVPIYGSPAGAYGAPPQSPGYGMGPTAQQKVPALVPCAACANPLSPAAVQCPRCGHPNR